MIRAAISDRHILPWFQPVTNNSDMGIAHYSALTRMIDEAENVVSAGKLIWTAARFDYINEMVESRAIFDIVRELGVDLSQGYYLGRPEPKI